MVRCTIYGLDKPSIRQSTGNTLAGKLKNGNQEEITSEAKGLSQPQWRKKPKSGTSDTRAREALIRSRKDLNFRNQKTWRATTAEKRKLKPRDVSRTSDGFAFRKTKGFSIRNGGRDTTSCPRLNRLKRIGHRRFHTSEAKLL